MISSYKLELKSPDCQRVTPSDGYKLYSWLLSQIPGEYGEELHAQQGRPISQFLSFDREKKTSLWHINLLSDETAELFSPVIEKAETIELHAGSVSVLSKEKQADTSFKDIVLNGRKNSSNRAELRFVTATSFKQAGRYVIFPQERLIVQSLVSRWNCFCKNYPLDDADALAMLEAGLCISDYSLRSVRYRLKNVYIPAFVGTIVMTSHLPAPLAELWNSILTWAPYSGIGIKTALGMGGVELRHIGTGSSPRVKETSDV